MPYARHLSKNIVTTLDTTQEIRVCIVTFVAAETRDNADNTADSSCSGK